MAVRSLVQGERDGASVMARVETHGEVERRSRGQPFADRAGRLLESFEQSPLALGITEGADHVVRRVTPPFLRLTGLPLSAVLGRPLADTLRGGGPGVERIVEVLDQVYQTREPVQEVEVAWGAADQRPAYRSLTVWPVADAAGRVAGLGLAVRDITLEVRERERGVATAEEMREINARLMLAAIREETLTEEAQAASDAKSAFLATMSHELRTPLNAIIGYGELLADGIPGPIGDAQHVQLERIRASAHHLLALIDQVLTLSRLEAGREPVSWEVISLAAVLDQVETLASPLAKRKQLTLRVLAPEPPVTFESDPIKVTQILVNLLGNAVRFTDQGEVVISARAEPGGVVVEVRDTGIGIAAPNLEHVFDPFWQVEQVHTRRVGGSGLGLSVCRRLARLLGGDVTVASTLGVGSTFTVRIPDHRLSPAREE